MQRFTTRNVMLVGLIALVAFTLGATEGDRVYDGAVRILGPNNKPVTSLEQSGDVNIGKDLTVSGKLKVGQIDLLTKLGELEEKVAGKSLKIGSTSIIMVGANEPSAGQQDYQFKPGGTQECLKNTGHNVLGAWPVIKDHHYDYNGNALFYRDWVGYFFVKWAGQNVIAGGTPQDKGRFPIDIMYLYEE